MTTLLLTAALAAPLLDAPLRDLVTPALEADHTGALLVGVVRKGEVAVHAFGTLAPSGPPTPRDRFEIGSISKGLNGLLLAEAIRRGEVAADDPVTRHLAWDLPTGPGGEDVTLAHLATHTSGWPRLPKDLRPPDPTDPYAAVDLAELRRLAEGTPLVDVPGRSYAYSNLGPSVLGAALAAAAGQTWPALLTDRILRPLAMKDTQVDGPRRVQGHDVDRRPVAPWTFDAFAPTGGLESSLRDLLDLVVAAQAPGGPLRATFDLAFVPHEDLGEAGHIGYGWHITREGVRWHNGGTSGFRSLVAVHPERSLGVVVLADTATPLVDAIGFSALEMLAGQDVAPLGVPPLVELADDALDARVGHYGPHRIARDGSHLVWHLPPGPARLWPTGDHTFVTRRPVRSVTFTDTGLTWTDASGTHEARRNK
jgi:CubicO group peptidase (beta-lactamase class C family)